VGGTYRKVNMLKLMLLAAVWSAIIAFIPRWVAAGILLALITAVWLQANAIRRRIMGHLRENSGGVRQAEVIHISNR
jgi:uncharacterized membrane protein